MKTALYLTLTFLPLWALGCAGTSHIRGEKAIPMEDGARVSVGETSVWIMPQMRVSNGVVFVMEEGRIYWSRRFIKNNDILRLEDDRHVKRWVHLTPSKSMRSKPATSFSPVKAGISSTYHSRCLSE